MDFGWLPAARPFHQPSNGEHLLNSILKLLGLPRRYRRLADLIRDYAAWISFPGMDPPRGAYERLYICYAKLAIAHYWQGSGRDRKLSVQKLIGLVTIPRQHPDCLVPFDPANIAFQAVAEMVAERSVKECHQPGGMKVYVVDAEGAACYLPKKMRKWAVEAVKAAMQIEIHHSARLAGESPPTYHCGALAALPASDAELDRARKFLGLSLASEGKRTF